MNVQQKIEKWCRNERFVHYANERISEELVMHLTTELIRNMKNWTKPLHGTTDILSL